MKENNYNIDFWKNFNWMNVSMNNSLFALNCELYVSFGQSLLDICSGNGRDSKFFKRRGLKVTSFDHKDLDLRDKLPNFNMRRTFDHVYCRFVLHAIPEHLEDYVLINSNKVLNKGGLLHIEARSDKGEVPDSTHYRRLINKDNLRKKLERLNFKIEFEEEAKNTSIYREENPILIRFVARKMGEIETRGTPAQEKLTYNVINPVLSYYLLFTVKKILEDNNIPFFLVFGTLLGAYRDKCFIKHDTDIDLGLLEEYKEKVMQLIDDGYFAIYGFLFTREWHKKDHLKALQCETEYIDFWFFKKQGAFYKSGKFYNIKAHQIDDGYSSINFYGEDFKTVNNIEEYLTRHYPNCDWRKEVVDYHAKV